MFVPQWYEPCQHGAARRVVADALAELARRARQAELADDAAAVAAETAESAVDRRRPLEWR